MIHHRGRLAAAVLLVIGIILGGNASVSWASETSTPSPAAASAAPNAPEDDGPDGTNDGGMPADQTEDDQPSTSEGLPAAVPAGGATESVASDNNPGPSDSPEAPSPPPKADAPSAPTEIAASAQAQKDGHNVVVSDQTTETTIVEALPDGTFQLTSSALPVRVQRDNHWVDIDTTLSPVGDGLLAPVANVTPVRFSQGGDGPIAQVQLPSGAWFTESWELGSLPTPTVTGPVALYSDVIPGVDLQLTATTTGMTEVLVIKTPAAAADPRLADLELKVAGASLASSETGGAIAAPAGSDAIDTSSGEPTISDVDAESMLRANEPRAWDSSVADAGPGGPGGNAVADPVASTVSEDGTVSLDVAAITQTPGVTYPVYVDPDWGTGNIHGWSINRTYPNSSYLDLPEDSDGRGNQIVGYLAAGWTAPYPGDGREQLGISFWQMSTGPVAGKHILNARFNALETWSSSCSPRGVQLYRTTNPGAGSTWNQSTGVSYYGPLDTQNVAYAGYCGGSNWVGFNATQGVADIAAAGQVEIALALRAQDESDTYSWKRFNLGAQLVITYNTPPSTPTNVAMTGPQRGCTNDSSFPVYVNPKDPITLAATISDPDGTNVEGRFRVTTSSNLSGNAIPSLAPNGYVSGGSQASGTLQTAQIPANTLADETVYAFVVSAADAYDVSPTVVCYFRTLAQAPRIIQYFATGGTKTVGSPVSVTFTVATGGGGYAYGGVEYWWTFTSDTSSPPPVPIPPSSNGALPCGQTVGTARVECESAAGIHPLYKSFTTAPVDETATLWAVAFDDAGNVSVPKSIVFNAAANTSAFEFGPGHGWRTGIGEGESLPSPFSSPLHDSNETSGAAPTAGTNLAIPAGYPKTLRDQLPWMVSGESLAVLKDYGGVAIHRVNNGPDHATTASTTTPSGYWNESQFGQLAPAGVTTAGTVPLYSCRLSNGDYFTTTSSTCEGATNTKSTLGNIWTSPPAAVDGVARPSVALYRCVVGPEHFDSLQSNCEGQVKESTLGYLVNVAPMQTTAQAIDTTKSFSVSAWAKPDQPSTLATYNTIASQSTGGANSSFVLQEATGGGRHYRFCMTTQAGAAVTDCATASVTVANGQWVHVTGIWDAANEQLRLLIGETAVPAAVAHHSLASGDTTGTGVFMVGSSVTNGGVANAWRGSLANVTVFPGVISSTQRSHLSQLYPANG